MNSATPIANSRISKGSLWTGRILSALVALMLIMDAVLKFFVPKPVVDTFVQLGIPVSLVIPIGVILMVCVVLYVIPRTAILGAILLTGYLGGAVSIHLRAGSSLFGQTLFPTYIGILVWLGLYLRDVRVKAIF